MAKGKRIEWTAEELAWIEARRTMPRRELHAAFVATFGRSDVNHEAIKRLCKRKGWLTGRTGRFKKGQPGRREPTGRRPPNAFVAGRTPHNAVAVGTETIDGNGYVKICVAEQNPWTGARTHMAFKHRWLWEKANGPVPEGHALKCLDGDKTNCDPGNWIAVPKGMIPRLNGRWNGLKYDDAPPELRPIILAAARLDYEARERRKAR